MTGDDATDASIPIHRWPDPACRFAVADGTPVVRSTNDPFVETFGPVTTGVPVAEIQDDTELSPASVDDFRAVIAEDGPHRIRDHGDDPPDRYLARTVRADSATGGVVVFTPLPDEAGDGGDAGIDVDHVASVVSHDLRNPLDVATARLRAGRETGADEHFERVADAHERMERIIRDVLTLAGGTDVIDTDATVRLDEAAERAWGTVETGDSTLIVEDPLSPTTADPDRLRRLFENLFRNSVEHGSTTEPGAADGRGDGSAPDVTVRVGDLDGGFYVADDGPGIPADRQDRVFEPGYSTDDHGTGLGLAIVARIVELHGWSITATESETGGARIEITGVE
jgi:hypothetical protein